MDLFNSGVCVKSCPADTSSAVVCSPTKLMNDNKDKYSNCQAYIEGAGNTPFRYKTITAGSSCLPDGASYVNKDTFETIKNAFTNNAYGDAAARWIVNIVSAW